MTEDFQQAIMNTLGAAPSLEQIIPGRLVRFSTNGNANDDAGWALLFPDGEGGVYGCHRHRQGETEVWQARTLVKAEDRAAFREKVGEARETAKQQEEQRRKACREKAARIWGQVKPATTGHPYLTRKGVKAHGLRQAEDGRLIVPVRDTDGTLQGLQFIDDNGEKLFLSGTAKKGCYHSIGKPAGKIHICEGYATGASVYENTGHAAAIAFDCGNLRPVAEALRQKFPDMEIVVCADDDHATEGNPGLTKATEATQAVHGKLAVPSFPDARGPKDSDFNDLMRLAGAEAVKKCIEAASLPIITETLQQAVARLAALDPLEYEKLRKTEAKQLGIDRVSALDEAVKAARKQLPEENDSLFPEDEIHDEAVDGQQLVKELTFTFSRFSVLPRGSAITAALWVILTYCFDFWNTLPILSIVSPEKRCGKTTFLTTLGNLCNRALPVSNISPAAVYRAIEAFKPTLLIDEGDTFLRDNEELRGVINSGHTKPTAFVIRCEGDDNMPVRFSTWCAKAIAMIGTPPDTIQDRSITVNLRRKLPDERTEPHGDEYTDVFCRLRAMILRWIDDNESALRLAKPERLNTSNDRQADNWRPLLAIASIMGCEAEAREAALLAMGTQQDEIPAKIQLLQDIRTIFEDSGTDRISSAALVKCLVDLEDRPWCEWKHGKPLTQGTLSRLLRPFGIHSKTIRFQYDQVAKGYELESFKDTLMRYAPPIQSVTTLQTNNINKIDHFKNVTSADNVTLSKQDNYPESLQCNGVTFSKGGAGDTHIFESKVSVTDELEDFDFEAEVVNYES